MALVPSALSKTLTSFSPASVPGCVLWLDAADAKTFTLSGSNITGWNDKSVSKNHFVSAGASTSPILSNYNGLSAVYWGGENQQLYSISNSATPGGALRTVFYVIHCPGNSQAFIVTGTEAGGNPAKVFGMGKNAGSDYVYPFLYSILGADIFSNFQLTANPTILTARYGGSNITGWINGRHRQTKTTVFDTTPGVWYLGKRQQNGTGSFNSFMLELLQYNVELTEEQRQTVEGYLSRKWGFVNDLTAEYVYKTVAPFTRVFTPLDISGCILWLDAQDRTSYTLSSSNVTQWNDKSGNGSNVVRMSTGPTVSNFNGYPTLYIGGGGSLSNSSLSIPTSYSVAAIVNRTSGQDYQYVSKFHVAGDGYLFFGTSNGNFATFAGNGSTTWWDVNGNSPAVSVGSTPILLEAINDGTTMTPYTNGIAQNTKTGTTAVATGLAIGSDRLGGQTLNGNLGEYLLYGRPISGAERQQLEGYMAWRWGRVSDLSSSHPFKLVPPLVPAFTPLQISGCTLWFDATDPATITLSGSNVTQWNDKSGNGYNLVRMSAGPVLSTLNGRPALNIGSGGSMSNATAPMPTSYSIFIVANRTGGTEYQYLTKIGTVDTMGYLFIGTLNGNYATFAGTSSVTWWDSEANSPSVSVGSNGTVLGVVNNGSNLRPYTNGTLQTAKNGTTTSTSGIVIGSARGGGAVWTGSMGEFLFFNRAVGETERQQIEGYLAQKWNTRGSLPSTHGFKTIVP